MIVLILVIHVLLPKLSMVRSNGEEYDDGFYHELVDKYFEEKNDTLSPGYDTLFDYNSLKNREGQSNIDTANSEDEKELEYSEEEYEYYESGSEEDSSDHHIQMSEEISDETEEYYVDEEDGLGVEDMTSSESDELCKGVDKCGQNKKSKDTSDEAKSNECGITKKCGEDSENDSKESKSGECSKKSDCKPVTTGPLAKSIKLKTIDRSIKTDFDGKMDKKREKSANYQPIDGHYIERNATISPFLFYNTSHVHEAFNSLQKHKKIIKKLLRHIDKKIDTYMNSNDKYYSPNRTHYKEHTGSAKYLLFNMY
uniref:Uncharacterized protein n=1 Tax=Lepeophtheirus salmonis TaxID=72036 RepID=A0A0K2V6Z6_LEPSM